VRHDLIGIRVGESLLARVDTLNKGEILVHRSFHYLPFLPLSCMHVCMCVRVCEWTSAALCAVVVVLVMMALPSFPLRWLRCCPR